ncbi:MAG: DUF2892 domain-containing protein [Chitinophagaceae bacterium]|nr:DUF2892 domain-containing protein [Chitinophagaceae bacterium]
MKKNMGTADRIIRLLLAIVLVYLYVTKVVTGTIGIVLLVAGIVLAVTALINFCPLYRLLGVNTCAVKKRG